MSHSIYFYLTRKDMAGLEDLLRSSVTSFLVIDATNKSRDIVLAENLSDVRNDHAQGLNAYLARVEDKDNIVIQWSGGEKHWINQMRSPVIEVTPSYFDGTTLIRGRFYYQTEDYNENQERVEQSPEFLAWADQVFKVVKKTLIRDSNLGAYLGEEANILHATSKAKLVDMVFADHNEAK